MRRVLITLIFAAASIPIGIAVLGYLLLALQPCLCEKCDRRATRLTPDGRDMCERCAKEHMTELMENK